MSKIDYGICHICGKVGKLSFEHVPPESAFNDHRVLRVSFEQVLRQHPDNFRGRYQQKGAGAYTLCESCNSDTGSWYGPAYADWAAQAMRILIGTQARPTLEYPFRLSPLRVLKQVVCMFFSVNLPLFQTRQPDLVRFVLNKELKSFPDHIRVYAFYTFSDRSRTAPVTGVFKGLGSSRSSMHVFSELTFPPFGFVMTFQNSPPPEAGFCEISSFSKFDYHRDTGMTITMKFPLMPIYTLYPGDYRTRDATLADAAESERRWREAGMPPLT
jgi:hypothetical protein